jgi:branched-chain amino acid transport system substrate-binding protein
MRRKGGKKDEEMSRRISQSLLGILVVLAAFGLTSMVFPAMTWSQAKTVKIGVLEPLSGPLGMLGKLNKMAYDYAADKINSLGGVKSMGGAKIELLYGDDEGKPEVGISQTEILLRKGVCAMTGAYSSSVIYAATAVTERHKIPYVNPSGAAENINERGFKYCFRYMPTAGRMVQDQIKAVVYLGELTGKKPKKVGILVEDTLFGQATRAGVRKWAKEYSMEVVADLSYSLKQSDFTTEISKLKAAGPDITFMSPYLADAIQIRRTMYELRFESMGGIIGSSGLQHSEYRTTLGPMADYTFTLDHYHPDTKVPGVKEFHKDFVSKYGEKNITGSTALSYGSLVVLWDALERAGTDNGEKLRDAIAKTDLKVGERTNISPYGVKFDEKGENIRATLLAEQIQKGELIPFYPADMVSGKAIWPVPKWEEFVK